MLLPRCCVFTSCGWRPPGIKSFNLRVLAAPRTHSSLINLKVVSRGSMRHAYGTRRSLSHQEARAFHLQLRDFSRRERERGSQIYSIIIIKVPRLSGRVLSCSDFVRGNHRKLRRQFIKLTVRKREMILFGSAGGFNYN